MRPLGLHHQLQWKLLKGPTKKPHAYALQLLQFCPDTTLFMRVNAAAGLRICTRSTQNAVKIKVIFVLDMEQIIVLTRFRKTLLLHQICLQSQCNSSSTPALLLNLHETALQDILIHVIFDIIAIYNIFYMQYIFIYNMYYLVV